MIAAWLTWSAAAGLLLAAAARLGEAALRRLGWPTRGAWALALALGVALPPVAWLQARDGARQASAATTTAPADAAATVDGAAGDALAALIARAQVTVAAPPALAALDRPLLALWALLSAAALLRLALAGRRLRRARSEWREETVDGVAVMVAGRTGPAVAGVLRPAVVLPEWALAADRDLVRLMLAHEREHVLAHDPRLLGAGALLAALMPWSPGAWLALRRLRLAVEADCDRRVLRRHPDVRRYGGLLLEVGRRLPAAELLPLAALASSPSHLERRIRLMTMSRPRHPLAAGLGLASAAALLLVAACEMPRPTEVAPAGEMPLASIRSGGAYTVSGKLTTGAVREAVATMLPQGDVAAARGTPIMLYFVADASGRVVHAEYSRARTEVRTLSPLPSRSDAADAERTQVRVLMKSGAPDSGAGRAAAGTSSLPGAVASIDPKAIGSIEVLKAKAGDIVADSASVIWVTLKEGATLESARRAIPAQTTVRELSPSRRMTMSGNATRGDRSGGAEASLRSRLRTDAGVDPVYVIDGVVVAEADKAAKVDALHPDDIDSIEVLKGEAAAAKYGEAGRNGVIQITRKKRQ